MHIKRRPGHLTLNIYYRGYVCENGLFNSNISSKAQPGNEIRWQGHFELNIKQQYEKKIKQSTNQTISTKWTIIYHLNSLKKKQKQKQKQPKKQTNLR